jgi:putative oxidoreductase
MSKASSLVVEIRILILVVSQKLNWLPPLLARISVGILFLTSGWGKLHNLPKIIDFFTQLGIPHPELQAPFVATTEFVCGALVLIGLGTRIASIPLIITMIVALITAKKADIEGVSSLFIQSEYLLIVIFVWLAISGPGKIALDHLIAQKFEKSKS